MKPEDLIEGDIVEDTVTRLPVRVSGICARENVVDIFYLTEGMHATVDVSVLRHYHRLDATDPDARPWFPSWDWARRK
jgi:hypothetical protein